MSGGASSRLRYGFETQATSRAWAEPKAKTGVAGELNNERGTLCGCQMRPFAAVTAKRMGTAYGALERAEWAYKNVANRPAKTKVAYISPADLARHGAMHGS